MLSIAMAAICLAMPGSLQATTIFSENFDGLTPALGVTSAGPFLTVGGTNVDVVGGGLFGSLCAGPESGNCADLAGSGGNPLGQLQLATPLNLAAGTYDLSFDLIGSGRGQDSSTTVTFGSYIQTFLLTSGDQTSGVLNTMVSLAGGPTQLKFTNNGVSGGNGNIGALLDNVEITTGQSPVPEPGTISLAATGLLGAAEMVRRRLMR